MHANDVCIQCHSQGRPLKNPIEGRYYDWPVGFVVGQELKDYWQLEDHTLGQLTFTHGTDNNALLLKPASDTCLECHGRTSPNGPRTATVEQHTHHKAGSSGNECINCHMPRIEQTIADVNVRSHTFRFIAPSEAERLKMPNSCNTCHADEDAAWATNALKQWQNESPWRVAN